MASILAVGASFFWGLSFIMSRVGLSHSNTLSAAFITSVCCLFYSIVISLFAIPIELFVHRAGLYFIAAGFLGPLVGRFFLYVGFDRVGASIASPLAEIKPLYTAIGAVLILGEGLTPFIALGTFLIILGAISISSEESGGQIEKKWSKKDLVFPILAGVCFGIVHILRKMGLNSIPEPIAGVTIQNASALAFFPLLNLAQRSRQRVVLNNKRSWIIFSLSGLSMVLAQLCIFSALDLGQVVIVSPLASLSPIFVLLLAGLFIRKLERVTWKIVFGTTLTVAGTVVLTLLSQM